MMQTTQIFLSLFLFTLLINSFTNAVDDTQCSGSVQPTSASTCRHCFHVRTLSSSGEFYVAPCDNDRTCVPLVKSTHQPIKTTTKLNQTESSRFTLEKCGLSSKRKDEIVADNSTVSDGEFPWMVRIESRPFPMNSTMNLCGGTLIHPQWILTAGHCVVDPIHESLVQPNGISIFVGSVTKQSSIKSNVLLYLVHPQFRMSQAMPSEHDFALIKLIKPVHLSSHVGVVCLPSNNQTFIPNGTQAYTAGWGSISPNINMVNQARKAPLEIHRTGLCRQRGLLKTIHSALHVCAHSPTGQNICSGDSGSGLWTEKNNKWFIIGVASFGKALCSTSINNDNAFSAVALDVEWIRHIIQNY